MMQEYYFFRNVKNYDELVTKTEQAIARNSINKKNVYLTKTIELSIEEFDDMSSNLLKNQEYFFECLSEMSIKSGIWNCIAVISKSRGILVMSDGYQYARFTAILYYDFISNKFDK